MKSVNTSDQIYEIILSYLPLKDKCRLERTSKQFQRLMFRHQKKVIVKNLKYKEDSTQRLQTMRSKYNELPSEVKVDCNQLKNLLNKCHFVNVIEMRGVLVNDSVLDVISQSCPNLESIGFEVNEVSDEAITRFGQIFGHKLKKISMNDYWDRIKTQKLLSFCPNLTSISCNQRLFEHIDDLNLKIGNLVQLEVRNYIIWSTKESLAFGRFVDRYGHQMEKLYIILCDPSDNCLVLQMISRLLSLKTLAIDFEMVYSNEICIYRIREIVIQCIQLKKVGLKFCTFDINFDLFSFSDSKCLEEITIYSKTFVNLIDSTQEIKPLMELKKISIQCHSVGHPFFKNISKFVPNLRSLTMQSSFDLSNNSLIFLSNCKLLKRVQFRPTVKSGHFVDDSALIQLIDNCPELRLIHLELTVNISVDSIDRLKALANSEPNERIRFYCCLWNYEINSILKQMSRLSNLVHLNIESLEGHNSVTTSIKQNKFSANCSKSKLLSLDFSLITTFSLDFWQTFSQLKALKELRFCVRDYVMKELSTDIESIESLERISIEIVWTEEYFFRDLPQMAPNLKILELKCRMKLSNTSLQCLSQLKSLTDIYLRPNDINDHQIDDEGIVQLFDSCSKLNRIVFDFVIGITSETTELLKELAKERPEERFKFEFLMISSDISSINLSDLPNNLIIKIKST